MYVRLALLTCRALFRWLAFSKYSTRQRWLTIVPSSRTPPLSSKCRYPSSSTFVTIQLFSIFARTQAVRGSAWRGIAQRSLGLSRGCLVFDLETRCTILTSGSNGTVSELAAAVSDCWHKAKLVSRKTGSDVTVRYCFTARYECEFLSAARKPFPGAVCFHFTAGQGRLVELLGLPVYRCFWYDGNFEK